jgi:hypothetical protein
VSTLPRIDEHYTEVEAPPEATWRALLALPRTFGDRASARFARILGCDPIDVSGAPGEPGSTFPGFRVVRSDPPREMGLEGGHRFSDYTLDFRVEDLGDHRSRLAATTHAAFPGVKGQLYKTAVIRSRAHVLATKRLIHGVARQAERETMES